MSFHIPVGIFSCDRDVVTRLITILADCWLRWRDNSLWICCGLNLRLPHKQCQLGSFVKANAKSTLTFMNQVFRVTCWSRNDRLYNDALETLGNLHILPKSPVKLALNATFKSSFRQAITGGYVVLLLWWKFWLTYSKEDLAVALVFLPKRRTKNKVLIWRLLIILH